MSSQASSDLWNQLSEEDFDGHTAFSALSPEQKLTWLAYAAAFVLEARRIRTSRDDWTSGDL